LDAGVLKLLVDVFQRGEVQVATLITPIREVGELTDPATVKVIVGREGDAVYFSRWPIPFHRREWLGSDPWQAAVAASFSPGPWWKHLGIYAFRRERLLEMIGLPPPPEEICEELEQLRLLHYGIPVRCLSVQGDFIGIDTPEDLEQARSLIETAKGRKG
jgi:CMP-2-keto-3-deoxyoctulosonic acid synthetase